MVEYQYSEPLKSEVLKNCPSFTTLPIRVRKDETTIQAIRKRFLKEWKKVVPQSSGPLIGAQGPFGHCVSLVFPECPPERIAIVTKFLEFLYLDNDLLDEPEGWVLGKEVNSTPSAAKTAYERIRKRLVEDTLDIDHPGTMSLVISAQEYHASRVNPGAIPTTFEEFMKRRLVYSGFHVFAKFIALAMDFRTQDESMSAIEDIIRPLERAMALCNDYFSWPKDKEHFQQGKGSNVVAFLQQVEGISEEDALASIKRQIISLEESHNSAFDRLMNTNTLSPEVQSYLIAFRLAAGGLHFFTSTSDRYLAPGSAIAPPLHSAPRSSIVCGVLFIIGVIFLFIYL